MESHVTFCWGSWYMSMAARLRALLGIATFLALLVAGPSHAQIYPAQPVTLVVPFTAGGGADTVARLVAEQMGHRLGQAFIVENRAGSSASVGAISVAHAPADGYTLLLGTATLAANAAVSPSAKLDVVNDFDFIGRIGRIDLLLVTHPLVPASDLPGLVELLRSRPDALSFGSPGRGSPAHLGVELFKQVTNTQAVHVAYRGESAAVSDLLGGYIQFQLCSPLVCVPRVQDGSLKALAVAAKQRLQLLPAVPTMAEAGVPGVEVGTWYYLAAPKGTSAAVIRALNGALNEVLSDGKVKARLLAMGVESEPGTTPAGTRNALQAEMVRWRPVAKAAGLTK